MTMLRTISHSKSEASGITKKAKTNGMTRLFIFFEKFVERMEVFPSPIFLNESVQFEKVRKQ